MQFWGSKINYHDKRNKLIGHILLILLGASFPYGIIFSIWGYPKIGLSLFGIDLIFLSLWRINRQGYTNVAAWGVLLTACLSDTIYAAIFGHDAGIHYLLFSFLGIPLIVFHYKERIKTIVGCIIPVLCFFSLYLTNFTFPYQIQLPNVYEKIVFHTVSFVTFSIMYSYIYSLISSNYKSEKKLEKEIEKSTQLALLSKQSMGICHEIRTPLTILRLELEDILENIQYPKKIKEYTASMMSQIDILDNVVKVMLRFGSESASLELASLKSVLEEFSGMFQRAIKTTEITLVLDFKDVPEALLDKRGIFQIILNLISNARDAMKEKGHIKIACYPGKYNQNHQIINGICLEVSDTGPGIPKKIQSQLFDPHYTSKGPGHLGLGLSIVHRIIHHHSGLLNLSSVPKKTTFQIWFPAEVL